VVSSSSPVVEIECVSCTAYSHNYLIPSKSLSFAGNCTSSCTKTSVYSWIVLDAATNAPVTVATTSTTTGLGQQNFVIKANTLPDSTSYIFRLEVTESSNTGFAQQTIIPSSKPTGGSCSVTPTTNVVPGGQISVLCQNFVDSDTTSGLYYLVKVLHSGTTNGYVAYYGSRSAIDIYLSPFANSSMGQVDVQIQVFNDHTAVSNLNTL